MNSRVRPSLLAALVLTAPLMACARAPEASSSPAAQAVPATAVTVPSAPLVSGLPDFTRLVDQVAPAVVNIEARIGSRQPTRGRGMPDDDQIPEIFRRMFPDMPGMPGQPGQPGPDAPSGRSVGSGFIISDDGYILTNHHVVDGAESITVRLSDRREFTAKLVGSDPTYDVALLKVEGKGLPVLRHGRSAALKPGQWVVAIGSPLGLDQSVTAGIVSAVGRTGGGGAGQQYVPFIQTDVAINRGNSGGPLLNTAGEVVGINSQILSNSGGYMGVSFAIPIDLAMGAVEQIKTHGRVSRGMLGVQVQAIDAGKAQVLGLNKGALVNSVEPGSAAEKAGIEIGDVIVSVNGQPVATSADLPPMVGMLPPGTKATVGVIRDGKSRDLAVTLGELPADAQRAAAARDADGTAPAAPQGASLLGLRVAELDGQSRRLLGLGPKEGVGIARVESAEAREAGLQPGMAILRVGRSPVGSVAELERELRGARKGEPVMLLVRSPSGATSFVALTAGSRD